MLMSSNMLKIFIFAVIVVASHSIDWSQRYNLYIGQSKFAISMMQSLVQDHPHESVLFSAHTTYRLLLLAYVAAEGETKNALKTGLCIDWIKKNEDEFILAFCMEKNARAAHTFDTGIEFDAVNKLYVPNEAAINFMTGLLLDDKHLETVDFSNAEQVRVNVNAFVAQATENHIKDLLPLGSIPDNANIAVANGAYFKGFWATKFNQRFTRKQSFHGETEDTVEMMQITGRFKYGILEKEKAYFVELPFEDPSLSMIIYLPIDDTPSAVNDVLQRFSDETINRALTEGSIHEVELEMPKMTFGGEYMLSNYLKSMGMKNIFGSTGNFSNLASNIQLSLNEIPHKTLIEIDEKGIDKGTNDAYNVHARDIEAPIATFYCDHPFLFTVNDRDSLEVLFFGAYRGPQIFDSQKSSILKPNKKGDDVDNKIDGKSTTVSLDQFTVLNELGKGGYGSVFLAKKNGGSDDGNFYAMKVINSSFALNHSVELMQERKILELARKSTHATGLHYAFRVGKWLFLVMDLATGGSLISKLDEKRMPDTITAQRIIAEIVIAVEDMHRLNVHIGDLQSKNVVIDGEGHMLVIDFGFSKITPNVTDRRGDWGQLCGICVDVFSYPFKTEQQKSLVDFMSKMTDDQLSELKKQPFFQGVDWHKVADRTSEPPYERTHVQLNQQQPTDVRALFKINEDDELDAIIAEKLRDFSYVAPEHQN